jgi:hypothetical protein
LLDHYKAVAGDVKVAFNPFVGNVFSAQRSEGCYFTYTPNDFAFSDAAGTMSWKKMFLTSSAKTHIIVEPCLDDLVVGYLESQDKDEAYWQGICVQRPTGVAIEDIVPVVEMIRARSRELITLIPTYEGCYENYMKCGSIHGEDVPFLHLQLPDAKDAPSDEEDDDHLSSDAEEYPEDSPSDEEYDLKE